MRITMVSEHASPLAVVGGVDAGGQNVHVAALASALAERGHDVVVYTRRDSSDVPDRVELRAGVVVEHLTAGPAVPIAKDDLLPHMDEFAHALARRFAEAPPPVVHAHFWMSGLAALRAAAPYGVPVVQTFHALGTVKRRLQGDDDTSPVRRIGIEREVARRSHRVVATCTDEVHELVLMGTPRSRIDVVASGVDVTRFTPDGPAAPRTRRPRLLVIGRLVPRKGVDDAITALASIADAELFVAGGPAADELGHDPEAARLGRLARALGVDHRVHLLGRVPREELPALIRSADLVLCLPWYEPFGIVPLEAMACGVPVVGSAVGGLLDTVIDGVTGALLPPRKPMAVADRVCALLHDADRLAGYSAAGIERVRSHYQWPQLARATERSYLRAMTVVAPDRVRDQAEVAG